MAHCEWPKFHGHFHSVPTAPLGHPGRTRGYASVELCAMLDRLRRASARDCTFSRSAAATGMWLCERRDSCEEPMCVKKNFACEETPSAEPHGRGDLV